MSSTRRPSIFIHCIALLLALTAIAGWLSVDFNKDLLAIFPQKNEKVKTMAKIKSEFERGGRLLVLVQTYDDEHDLTSSVNQLANALKSSEHTSSVLFQPIWEEDKKSLTELLAYLWINAPPEEFSKKLGSLAPDSISNRLEEVKEDLALSFDPAEISTLSRDPFGFLEHPAMAKGEMTNPFVNEDANSHLILVYPNNDDISSGEWFDKLKEVLDSWETDHPEVFIELTGGPAFASEISSNVKRDVIIAILISSIFSGIIFWLLTRNNRLIHLLLCFVFLILVGSYGIGSLMFGSVSLMSMGFASILIGLSVDYGMIICLSARKGKRGAQDIFREVSKPIFYASLSTAAVFFALCLSDLPGIQELGLFVGVGILLAAFVLLFYFTPLVQKFSHQHANKKPNKIIALSPKKRWISAIILSCFIAIVLAHGIPKVIFDLQVMTPPHSPASSALKQVEELYPLRFNDKTQQLILSSKDASILKEHTLLAEEANQSAFPVSSLIPISQSQKENQLNAKQLVARKEQIIASIKKSGFKEDTIRFNQHFLETLEKLSSIEAPFYLTDKNLLNWFDTMLDVPPTGANQTQVEVPTEWNHPQASSWKAIEISISEQLRADLIKILIVVSCLTAALLMFAVKNFRKAIMGFLCLGTPIALIIFLVHYTSLEWNFLNIFAIPLLLGLGVDYVIHITLTTKSEESSQTKGIQQTLLACGSTSVVGFLSLLFSSNAAFVSLGLLCGLGIILTMISCLILLPKLICSVPKD